MDQGDVIIANLQSALDCVGRCDCCDGLQAQINDLRSQLSTKIGQEEKPLIVQQSVASAEQLIVPWAIGAIAVAVNSLRAEIAAAAALGSQATAAAAAAANTAATALSQLAGLAAGIAAILVSIATLSVLGQRIDAVESFVQNIANGLSGAMDLIGSTRNIAVQARDIAGQALRDIDDLRRYVGTLSATILAQVDAKTSALRIELEGIIDARISELDGLIKDIISTLSGIIARLVAIEIQLPSFRESIAFLQSQVNSIFIRVGILEGDTANIKSRVGILEGAIAVVEADIAAIAADIAVMWPSLLASIATIPALVQQGIQTFVPPLVQTLVPSAVQELAPPLIQTLVPPIVEGSIPRIVENVISVVNNWISINLPSVVTNIVNSMPVDLSPVLQAIAKVDVKVDDTLEFVKTVDETTKETKVVAYTVNGKMGPPIIGGLSGWMIRFTGWAVLDRLVNLLTLATTIHNAQQLSSNIFVTLITVMQNVVDFFGIKDSEGKIFNLSSLIGQTLTSLVTLVIGEENYNNFAKEWAKYNRTYQAAANLFSSLMNMGDTVTQALQVVSSQTGKIGNALREWGVVSEKAYSWMNPNPNFSNPLLTKLTSLQETASMVENVSQQPLNVKSAKEEVETASKELMDSLEQKDDSKQGPTIPEAKKVKTEQMEIVAASKGKDLAESDLTPDEDGI